MLTALGIFSMMGAACMGVSMSSVEVKGGGWWATGIYFAFATAMLGCLAMAYRCFGGEF